ncbi:MAG: exonuclease domain-containing protein [Candidatus Delongbacteria bacterium]|jgi:predicted DnaQ family exonuclease/DinG family helicase|nr:exonuclease domain-containing protein [Candidatus Delongbacteria bacterium]
MKKIYKELKLQSYVVFDLETTGTDYFVDKIIEIAGIKYENGEAKETFNSFVNPKQMISEQITNLTGITNSDLDGQPEIDDVLPKFLDFIDDLPLVAHNIDFDLSFIKYQIQAIGAPDIITKEFHDTLLLSQIFFPVGPANHKLSTLANYLNIQADGFHRALNDCIATGELFNNLIERSLKLAEGTVKKIASVAGKSKYVKYFVVNLANYYIKTSFDRKIIKNERKSYLAPNILEQVNQLDHDEILKLHENDISEKIFSDGGLLSKIIPKYEYREEQYLLSKKCDEIYNDEKFLISEAGTGVGKSFAYLVPSIVYSLLNETKIIISTNTKNLQEQIFYKDLPILHEMFNESFKAVILKGRNNYLCLKRYESICQRPADNLSEIEINQFLPLVYWAETTSTGDIEENSGFKIGFARSAWSKTVSDKGYCSGKKCKFYKRCFLQNARKNSFNSNLVIVNHSLLFSDLASGNAVLGNYENLVIDEAHNVEASATKYLGVEYSLYQLKGLMFKIYSPRQKNNFCKKIENNIGKVQNEMDNLSDLNDKLKEKVVSFYDKGVELFEDAADQLNKKLGDTYRFRGMVKNRYKDISEIFTAKADLKTFKTLNEEVIGLIRRINIILKIENEQNNDIEEIFLESESILDQAKSFFDSFIFLTQAQRENDVFWYELSKKDTSTFLSLFSAPLNVSKILQNYLYDTQKSIIFTSATLTIENRFKYMKRKLGLDLIDENKIETLMLGSPFDLENQLKIVIPSYFAPPRNSMIFDNDITEFLSHLASVNDDGTLALFTSYKQMREIAGRIREIFAKNKRLFTVQGMDGNRSELIKQFKQVTNSFLFGTDSFWEGIDVPGDALHTLIIIKLPFAVPSEPVIQARIEEIEKKGNDAFMFYSVPEAILKLKQGVGRLIRHNSDRGIVYIFDSRLSNTRWGRAFLNSLPVEAIKAESFSAMKSISKKY